MPISVLKSVSPNLQMRRTIGETSILVTLIVAVTVTKETHRRKSTFGLIVSEA